MDRVVFWLSDYITQYCLLIVEVVKLQFPFALVQWCSGGPQVAIGVSFGLKMEARSCFEIRKMGVHSYISSQTNRNEIERVQK